MAKTLKVARLVELTNAFLAHTPDSASEARLTLHNFTAKLLHETGCYAGFGYLQPYGSPGSDESRTFLYLHRKAQ